ncbi:MAG: hypothetical protein QOH64_2694 [Acidimicrobiaceae bacterium]
MTARPRLVHLTTTDMSLALLLGPQLRAYRDAGYEVFGASAPGPYVGELEGWGVEHLPLRHATRAMRPDQDVRALGELTALFRRLRPTIVHTHNPKPGVYGRLSAWASRVPGIVNTVHGLYALPDDRRAKRAIVYGLERVAARCSDIELVQNPEDLDVLAGLGIPRSKLRLLGNGVDLTRFEPPTTQQRRSARAHLGAEDGEVIVGVVGRLVREKGYREVFEAAARLVRGGVPVRFVVVGPSDPAKQDAITEEECERASRDGNVTFLGLRHDVERIYHALDLYVLASYREGFPRSAMEAAATGLPLVATDIRGCRQVVEHGKNGLLVPAGDAAALAAAVAELASDAERRVRMGEASVAKALAEFDQQAVIDTTLAAYAELCR